MRELYGQPLNHASSPFLDPDLQGLQEQTLEGGNLGCVVNVMNDHYSMLTSLESSCAKIESDMNLVQQSLQG